MCCIVFNIDGRFSFFIFSSRFMLFGGGGCQHFFLEKQLFFISHFLCYFQHSKKKLEILKSAPSLNWLNGRWFLQIVDRDGGNLYPIYPLFPCSDFLSQMLGWFLGGGGCNVFLAFYAISNISRKK